jgi:lauroyl/myristoyl acyltransferase
MVIIPLFITYNKKTGKHQAIIHPQLEVVKTEDKDNDILVNTARLTNIVEEHI